MTQFSRVWIHEELGEIESLEFCGGTIVAHTRRCPGKLTSNEDAAALVQLSPEHGVLVVADGMGGASLGDEASRITVQTIVEKVSEASAGDSVRSEILDAIEAANQKILDRSVGAGATLVVVEFCAGQLRVFHVGDAGALVCSNRGRTKFSAVAHAPVAMAVEIGILNESEGLAHEDRHLISNCVGSREMKIELGPPMKMSARDTLIVASDGLFDNLTTTEIIDFVRSGNLLKQTSDMIALTGRRMNDEDGGPSKPDDLTLLCFRQ